MAMAIISRRTTTTIDKMRKPLGLHSETYSIIKGTKSSPIAIIKIQILDQQHNDHLLQKGICKLRTVLISIAAQDQAQRA